MKRRIVMLLVVIAVLASSVAIFAGCAHEHTLAEEWAYDNDYHWYVCSECDEQVDKAEHTLENGVCTVCGADFNHYHNASAEWVSDEVYHWHTCSGCDEQVDKAEHEVNKEGICTICNKAELPVPWDGETTTEVVADQDGNYVINTAAELAWVAEQVNNDSRMFVEKTIKLGQDINLNNKPWKTIDAKGGRLSKTIIDGNGFTIRNLLSTTLTNVTDQAINKGYGAGFIGNCASSITIKNITFDHATINTPNANVVGIILGYTYGTTVFENVAVTNSTVRGYGKVGPFVGMGADPGVKITFKDCVSAGNTINSTYNAGGLAGNIQRKAGVDNTVIDNCRVENNTFVPYSGEEYYTLNGENATFKPDDKAGEDIVRPLSGKYWYDGKYLWSAYAVYYCSYGDSSYDAPIIVEGKEYKVANSEICVDTLPAEQ